MGKRKGKKFIDKKKAHHFYVVHRSLTDPLSAENDKKFVLMEAEDKKRQYAQAPVSTGLKTELDDFLAKDLSEFDPALFEDDPEEEGGPLAHDYDYSKHLKPINPENFIRYDGSTMNQIAIDEIRSQYAPALMDSKPHEGSSASAPMSKPSRHVAPKKAKASAKAQAPILSADLFATPDVEKTLNVKLDPEELKNAEDGGDIDGEFEDFFAALEEQGDFEELADDFVISAMGGVADDGDEDDDDDEEYEEFSDYHEEEMELKGEDVNTASGVAAESSTGLSKPSGDGATSAKEPFRFSLGGNLQASSNSVGKGSVDSSGNSVTSSSGLDKPISDITAGLGKLDLSSSERGQSSSSAAPFRFDLSAPSSVSTKATGESASASSQQASSSSSAAVPLFGANAIIQSGAGAKLGKFGGRSDIFEKLAQKEANKRFPNSADDEDEFGMRQRFKRLRLDREDDDGPSYSGISALTASNLADLSAPLPALSTELQQQLDEQFEVHLKREYGAEFDSEMEEDSDYDSEAEEEEYRGDFEIEQFRHIIKQHNEQSEKTSRKLQPQSEAIYHTHRAIDNFAANDEEYDDDKAETESRIEGMFKPKVRLQFDCESIISTYSTTENLPHMVRSKRTKPKRKKKPPLPAIGEDEDGEMSDDLDYSMLDDPRIQSIVLRDGVPVRAGMDSDDEDSDGAPRENLGKKRPKAESKAEKKARKQALKAERRVNRERKKQLRQAFQVAERRQVSALHAAQSGNTVQL